MRDFRVCQARYPRLAQSGGMPALIALAEDFPAAVACAEHVVNSQTNWLINNDFLANVVSSEFCLPKALWPYKLYFSRHRTSAGRALLTLSDSGLSRKCGKSNLNDLCV